MSKIHANVVATRRECVNNEGGSLTSSPANLSEVRQRRLVFGHFEFESGEPSLKRPKNVTQLMRNFLHTTECSAKFKLIFVVTPIVLLGLDNKSPTLMNASICLFLGVSSGAPCLDRFCRGRTNPLVITIARRRHPL